MRRATARRGFSLIEVIIAIAIVAIMAGALTPFAIKRLNDARSEATTDEMLGLKTALLAFNDDLGRFPSQPEGLAVLVTSAGLSGQDLARWSGPYVGGGGGDLLSDVQQDAFGSSYVYTASPTISPADVADIVLSSAGANKTQELPDAGTTWVVGNADLYDDLVFFISRAAPDRQRRLDTLAELEALADAAREYYRDIDSFPGSLADLSGSYIDPGFADDAFSDEWDTDYVMSDDGASPPTMTIRSCGPDLGDDSGGGDDLELTVSGAAIENTEDPGGGGGGGGGGGSLTTAEEVSLAQAALDADPNVPPPTTWAGAGGAREALGLDAALDTDEWGNSYSINGSDEVFSSGPDGNSNTKWDNIPVGVK